MNKHKFAYPLWFAIASLVSLALYLIFYALDNRLLVFFLILIFPLALVAIVGGLLNFKQKKHQSLISIFLASIPFILLVIVFFYYEEIMDWQDSKQTGPPRTLVNMTWFASCVQQFSTQESVEIPQTIEGLIKILQQDDKDFTAMLMACNPPEETSHGKLVDYWNRPIVLVVNSPTEYKLISYGHNGKDDKGQGDDVVVTFNPTEEGDMSLNLE